MNRVQGGQGPTGPVEGRPPEPAGAEARDAQRTPLKFQRVGELAGGVDRPAAPVERVFRKPVVLSVAAFDSIVSARQALAFVEAGFEVDAFCPHGHALARINYVRSHQIFDAFDPVTSLRQAIEESEPDLVSPADGRAVAGLHALHAVGAAEQGPAGERLCALIARSLGEPKHFADLTSRCRVLEIAHREGVRRPAAFPSPTRTSSAAGSSASAFPRCSPRTGARTEEGARWCVRRPRRGASSVGSPGCRVWPAPWNGCSWTVTSRILRR